MRYMGNVMTVRIFFFAFILCVHAGADEVDLEKVTDEAKASIQAGLNYLHVTMQPNGYWEEADKSKVGIGQRESNRLMERPSKEEPPFFRQDIPLGADAFAGPYRAAQTALSGMALLANGNTPTRGQYAADVRAVINYFINKAQTPDGVYSHSDPRPMFGHAFALMFLAQAYGMDRKNEELKKSIKRGIDALINVQSIMGGWYYRFDLGNGKDEGMLTAMILQALRISRDAGIEVPKSVIDGATWYLNTSRHKNWVRYTLTLTREVQLGGLGLVAASVCVYAAAGDLNNENFKAFQDKITSIIGSYSMTDIIEWEHEFYRHYLLFYLSQAAFIIGGDVWNKFYSGARDWLIRDHDLKSGSWNCSWGRTIATAISVLVLSIPYRYLPLFDR